MMRNKIRISLIWLVWSLPQIVLAEFDLGAWNQMYGYDLSNVKSASIADINGDGYKDIVVASPPAAGVAG